MNKTKSILMEYFDIDEIEVTNRFKRETLYTSQELSTQLLFEKFILGSIQDYFKKRLNQGCPTRGIIRGVQHAVLSGVSNTRYCQGCPTRGIIRGVQHAAHLTSLCGPFYFCQALLLF